MIFPRDTVKGHIKICLRKINIFGDNHIILIQNITRGNVLFSK